MEKSVEIPLYLDIVSKLKAEIESGRYRKQFPSEAQLVRRYKVSRQTIIRVMAELARAGLIERYRGSGTVVSRKVNLTLGRIGLVLPWLSSAPFYDAIAGVCREEGYTLLYRSIHHPCGFSIEERLREAQQLAADFADARVSGLILQPVQDLAEAEDVNREIVEAFQAKQIPVVLIDHDICFLPQRSRFDVVAADNIHAGYLIGRHLIAQGAHNIAFLMHPNWAPTVHGRLNGVAAAVLEAGLEWSARKNVLDAEPDDVKGIARAVRARRPDAIVCGNDIEAARLLKTLKTLRIRVPDRIMVTGIDDEPFASLVTPSLTTVRQDFEQIAEVAARRLFERIRTPNADPVNILLQTKLIVRESTGKK